jgi:hypothetical protein
MVKKTSHRKTGPRSQPARRCAADPDWLRDWIGSNVVVDVRSPFVYLGILRGCRSDYLLLENADAHDLRDGSASRELYVVESREHGIRPNRGRVLIRLEEVVSISRLEDVLLE